MRTSAKVTLAISIILLLLGIGLVFYGTYASIPKPEIVEYSAPGWYSYSYSYTSYSNSDTFAGLLCTRFGRLSFLSGLVTMFIFTYLAVQPVVKKDDECKCNKAQDECKCKRDSSTVKDEECECKVEDEEKKCDPPSVIQLGAPEDKTE